MARVVLVVAALAAAVLAVGAPRAAAAPWCGGDEVVADRPDAVTGAQLHVVYAYPADGGDDFATWAPQIVGDAEALDGWWQKQDPARSLRFDLAAFPGCGGLGALDLGVLKLSLPASAFSAVDGRFQAIFREVVRALPQLSPWKKVVVYYDGPVDRPEVCGTGGGSTDNGADSLAVIWTRSSCQDKPARRAWVAAHEITHELGAPTGDQPHPYSADDRSHVGDAGNDLMFPYVGESIDDAVLDVGRDDYYRHGGAWFDLATSAWLRHLDAPQQPLAVAISGGGRVVSDLPGVDCTASCTTQWDAGAEVSLDATAGTGQRFVGWRGGCLGDSCTVTLSAPVSVQAVFGLAEVPLVVRVAGRGSVTGAGVSCPKRCRASVAAGDAHPLRARAAKGWRFAGWGGACRGTRAVCTVRPEAATAVRARFVLAKTLRPKR